jgi:hypothetical protein
MNTEEKKYGLSIWETARILNEDIRDRFHELRRFRVLAARRLVRKDELSGEARETYYELIESAIESL